MPDHRLSDQWIADRVHPRFGIHADACEPGPVVDDQESHEAARAFARSNVGLEVRRTLCGSGRLANIAVFDGTCRCFESGNDLLEGSGTDMLVVFRGECIDHGDLCLVPATTSADCRTEEARGGG